MFLLKSYNAADILGCFPGGLQVTVYILSTVVTINSDFVFQIKCILEPHNW